MPWPSRFLLRLVVALASFALVSVALVGLGAAIALAIDWEIPEGRELHGPTRVYDRHGNRIANLSANVEHRPVALKDISPHLRNAVIATEDRRFYEHQGVDPVSLIRAVVSNLRFGGIREGGSTLTQQYVKNVYVGSDRTLFRKIREAVVALQLEKERSKDEILTDYLNHVYFGQGAYGAEAAARTFFDKSASELEPHESATLASSLSAPTTLNARADRKGARARRNVVLDEMEEADFLTQNQTRRAKRQPLRLARREAPKPRFRYFVEEVRRQLLDAYGEERVYQGGLRVVTSLDASQQRALRQEVLERLPDDRDLDAGVVALDPSNGDVLAVYSGRSFKHRQVDLAFGRGTNGRPSGSTFKAFVLAAALEDHKSLSTTYPAPSAVSFGGWSVGGDGGCGSSCDLLEATARSANTVFAQLANDVGADDFTQLAKRVGVRQRFAKPDLPMALGTADVTPLDMASAFGTFANDGVACPARVITEVTAPDGPLDAPDPRSPNAKQRRAVAAQLRELGYRFDDEDLGRCYRAVAPSVARNVTEALEAVVAWGTGRDADIGRPQAGKTGTTQANREAWFAGYTPALSIAVSFYNVERQETLIGVPGCSGVCFGGDLPASIWRAAAVEMLDGVKPQPFPEPIPDERTVSHPDRRRLGPSIGVGEETQEAEPDDPEPTPTPSATPTPTPDASPDNPREPEPTPAGEPPPEPDGAGEDEDPDGGDDDGGGIVPPLPDPP